MHVLFYTPHWNTGGIERLITYIVGGLSGRGYNFSILTEDYSRPYGQFSVDNARVYFRDFRPFNAENSQRLASLLSAIAPDVVVAMGSSRALYKPSRALIGQDIPVIMSEHNASKQMVKGFNNDWRFYNAVRDLADLNHVLFESYAEEYDKPEKVRVIGNPVLPTIERAYPIGGESWLVSLARYDLHQKQQDVLVRSFASIAERHPTWKLALYGEDWKGGRAEVQRLASTLGLGDRVTINGSTSDVSSVLNKAKLLAFPSAYEGFPLAAGEALAHGVPIIGFSDCDGVNQLVTNGYNGLLAGPGVKNVKAFAEAMSNAMANEDLRISMAANARKSVEAYTLDAFLQAWASLLDEAHAIRGKNRLKTLTRMEQEYIQLVASGTLFDEIHRHRTESRKNAKLVRGVERILSNPSLRRVAKFAWKRIVR